MTQLTDDTALTGVLRPGDLTDYPLQANVKINIGGAVVAGQDGEATGVVGHVKRFVAGDETTHDLVGIALANVDNTVDGGGAAAALFIQLQTVGVYLARGTGFTLDSVNKPAFLTDDNVVVLSTQPASGIFLGYVVKFRSTTLVDVAFDFRGRGSSAAAIETQTTQTIDMADAGVDLIVTGTPTGIQVTLTGEVLLVDPNSSGLTEILKLPPEADMKDRSLQIIANGGEGITVQNDAGGAIQTIPSSGSGWFHCDGTTWFSGPQSSDFAIDAEEVASGVAKILMRDNVASAFDITEAANSYLKFVTTDASEEITIGQKLNQGAAGTIVIERTNVEVKQMGLPKVGGTAGWAVNAANDISALAKVPASQTASTLVIPLGGFRAGDKITGYRVTGQIESGGNVVTLDAALRRLTAAAGDLVDAAVASGGMTQVSVTADALVNSTVTGVDETVGVDDEYYLLLTATTGASTDIDLLGVAVVTTEQ